MKTLILHGPIAQPKLACPERRAHHGLQELEAKMQHFQWLPTIEESAGQAGRLPGVTLFELQRTCVSKDASI